MYKVSVIMPVFNAEEYLRNTLNSVINQSIGFENIELILVDDCSMDNSRDIIDEYSENYSNIKKIFLDKNSGWPGGPRNVGIKNATSDYIMFIDDDDEYLPEICEKLYDTIILEDADTVVCNVLWTNREGCTLEKSWCVRGGEINFENVVYDNEIIYFSNGLIWDCIFKKSIILDNDLWFVDSVIEDSIFIWEYAILSKKLVYLNDFVGCHHVQREDSISNITLDREIETINCFYSCVRILEENNVDLNRFFEYWIIMRIKAAIFLGNKYETKELLSKLSDFERKINFNGYVPLSFRLINYFIKQGNLSIAMYCCLFFLRLTKSKLLLNIYWKFFDNESSL